MNKLTTSQTGHCDAGIPDEQEPGFPQNCVADMIFEVLSENGNLEHYEIEDQDLLLSQSVYESIECRWIMSIYELKILAEKISITYGELRSLHNIFDKIYYAFGQKSGFFW